MSLTTAAEAVAAAIARTKLFSWRELLIVVLALFCWTCENRQRKNTVLFSMSGKRRGNGPFKMTLAQQARTMSYYNPAIKKENFLTADRNGTNSGLFFLIFKQMAIPLKGPYFYCHRRICCAKRPKRLLTGPSSSI